MILLRLNFLRREVDELGLWGVVLVVGRCALQALSGCTAGIVLAAFTAVLTGALEGRVPWMPIVVWAGASLAAALLNVIDPVLHHLQNTVIPSRRTQRWLRHLACQPFSQYLSEAARNERDRAEMAVTEIPVIYTRLADQANSVGMALGFAALLWSIHPLLVIVATVTFMPLGITQWRHGQTLHDVSVDETPHRRQARYFESILLGRRSLPEIRLLQAGPFFMHRWSREVKRAERLGASLAARNARKTMAPMLVAIAGMAANLLLVVWLREQRVISSPQMVTAAFAVWEVCTVSGTIAGDLATLRRTLLQISDYHEMVPVSQESKTADAPHLPEEIALHDVWYKYPEATDYALRGVSCIIRRGEHVALVGKNGSGKTTLLLVMMGLLKPERGRVLYDGKPVDESAAGAWSAVFQDFVRYPVTIKENVAFDSQTIGVIIQPILTDRLRDVWDLPAGKEFARGIDLSQGEWQRLAIARALHVVETQSRWFAFDEASAWMDPLAEVAVLSELDAALRGHTALFISHRMGFARRAARILVCDEGQITQDGPHEELVARDGLYRTLFQSQASAYSLGSGR